jgi:hypothetical protein
VPRIRNIFNHPVAAHQVVIEKAQCAHCLIEHCSRDLFPLNQEQLVFRAVFRSQLIR